MQCIIEEKLDGLSISLEYKNGEIQKMVTRGDGKVGEDISPNIPFMTSIPNKIPDLGHVFIRGEAIVNWNNFKEHLANEFENPRNSASGLIRP
jgi:DNA ligase (NAD+)